MAACPAHLKQNTLSIATSSFFVKDKIEQGDLEVQYEPTSKMRGDMNT